MSAYLFDTSVLSIHLNASHSRHVYITSTIQSLRPNAVEYVSAIALAELTFGVLMAQSFGRGNAPSFQNVLANASRYGVLGVSHHTSTVYGEIKTALAVKYLQKASRKNRPRWIEDWVDKTTGQKLQVDENDLWLCAQAKERNLILVTSDSHMQRIADADNGVQLLIL